MLMPMVLEGYEAHEPLLYHSGLKTRIRADEPAIISTQVTANRFHALLIAAALLAPAAAAQSHAAADLGRRVIGAGLDANECYRVRDIEISKDEARIYLTDG